MRDDGRCFVTLSWVDPSGPGSDVVRVLVNINGYTDLADLDAWSMTREQGSNRWSGRWELPAAWRGGYSFIPLAAVPPPSDGSRDDYREQWLRILPFSLPDPTNSAPTYRGRGGYPVSPLHLPDAPAQPEWDEGPGSAPAAPGPEIWHSRILGNDHRIWMHQTGDDVSGLGRGGGAASGEKTGGRPLVVLLDGDLWAESMPIFRALDRATAAGRIAPAVYALVDAVDGETRSRELPCNRRYWRAVQEELLPQIAASRHITSSADRTVVAGQSYGGLAALFAALHYPGRFGGVIAQSASLWWPQSETLGTDATQDGELPAAVRSGLGDGAALRIELQVGSREPQLRAVNESMHAALAAAGHDVRFSTYVGGHDWLCWRGGLIDGLARLLGERAISRGVR